MLDVDRDERAGFVCALTVCGVAGTMKVKRVKTAIESELFVTASDGRRLRGIGLVIHVLHLLDVA